MNVILIGFGEIGKALFSISNTKHSVSIYDIKYDWNIYKNSYDIMLVAIPYTEEFVDIIKEYKNRFNPKSIIVFSSVAIGTCSKIGAVHSPIEGKHPNLVKSIMIGKRLIGGENNLATYFISTLFDSFEVFEKPEFTEFLKLRSTSLYGLNIEFARYTNYVCEKLGMDYNYVNIYDSMYNELYKDMKMDNFQRYILTPPEGEIGGHCVVPNAEILDSQFPSILLKEIYDRNY
jgi:hypothetical protein